MIARLFSRRRPAHVVFPALVALIPVLGIFLASINGGQMTDDRATAQDGADAMARMHATWSARALNTVSMNQVAMTQMIAVQIGSEALEGTLDEIELYAAGSLLFIGIHSLGCFGFKWPPAVAVCFAQHGFEARHPRRAHAAAQRIRRTFDPEHGIRTAHRALDAFEAMNQTIVAQFPRRMREIAEDYLRDLDIDDVHFTDPCDGEGVVNCTQVNTRDGMALPIHRTAAARVDACAGMEFGTDLSRTTYHARGFPRLRGPMTYGGSPQNRHLKRHINDVTGIWEVLENFKTAHQRMRLMSPSGLRRFPQALNLVGSQNQFTNSFTRRFDAKYFSACAFGNAVTLPLFDLTLRRPMPDFWGLVADDRTHLTAHGMPPEFKILAHVYKNPNGRVGEEVLDNHSAGQFAYAQAAVYNPEGANMFSQTWLGRLVPADKMDTPGTAGAKLATGGRASFAPLADYLIATQGAGWERIHAH